jgi:putative selenate reductase
LQYKQVIRFCVFGKNGEEIFGIPRELFFTPKSEDPFKIKRYGQILETPVGVAAGPHTQMSQNIISSWLVGARYMELKTVQILDELAVTKPCIDMTDEGYNCEWSQELKLQQSLDQYIDAWIILHILKEKFGFKGKDSGFIFNASVGYNLE